MPKFIQFLKDWTLPVSIGTGCLFYLIFAYLPQLDKAAQFFGPLFNTILPLFMSLILFVTFCKVDFRKMRPTVWHLWVSAEQVILLLILTGLVVYFRLQGNALILMEGIITCIIVPTASAAAVVTTKLGGDLNSMTSYTFTSGLLTALMVPLCFPLIEPTADITFWSAFLKILWKVCSVLLLPMVVAYAVKHGAKKLHRWIVSIPDLAFYLWGGSLMIVSGTTVKNIVHAQATVSFLALIGALALLICLIQFATGKLIGKPFGCTIDAGQALGQQNTAFGIWVASTFLNPLSSVGPGCYILWQNIINSMELWQDRRQKRKNEKRKTN